MNNQTTTVNKPLRAARTTQPWDRGTRTLHLGLALLVSLQLLISLVLEMPRPKHPLSAQDNLIFTTHEWLGIGALVIVLLHWGWSLWTAGGYGIRHLLPWNRAGCAGIAQELQYMQKLQLPPGGPQAKIAGLVHGLGMLAVTAMALSGAVLFFWLPENGALIPFTRNALTLHQFISTFVWFYWGGHVGMAVLHQLLAHDGALKAMFKLGRPVR